MLCEQFLWIQVIQAFITQIIEQPVFLTFYSACTVSSIYFTLKCNRKGKENRTVHSWKMETEWLSWFLGTWDQPCFNLWLVEVAMAPRLPVFQKCLEAITRMVWFIGWSFGNPECGLADPCGSLPTWDILWFYELTNGLELIVVLMKRLSKFLGTDCFVQVGMGVPTG